MVISVFLTIKGMSKNVDYEILSMQLPPRAAKQKPYMIYPPN